MPETPEQKAWREIDADLAAAGWVVQDRDEIDITAGRGVAESVQRAKIIVHLRILRDGPAKTP